MCRLMSKDPQLILAGRIQELILDLYRWMTSDRFSFNSSETQFIWFGTPQLRKLNFSLLSDNFTQFVFSTSLLDLEVILDNSLTFSDHITSLTRFSYYQLRRLRAIGKYITTTTMTAIVRAFVCSRVDYCNSLVIGLHKVRLSPIHSVVNAAARLIARLPKFAHVSSFMFNQLHWLPLS